MFKSATYRGRNVSHEPFNLDRDANDVAVELSFVSFDDYWRPFLGGQGLAGAYAASLSEPRRAALEASLRSRLLGTRQDGPFTLQARAWAVKGVVPARQ